MLLIIMFSSFHKTAYTVCLKVLVSPRCIHLFLTVLHYVPDCFSFLFQTAMVTGWRKTALFCKSNFRDLSDLGDCLIYVC